MELHYEKEKILAFRSHTTFSTRNIWYMLPFITQVFTYNLHKPKTERERKVPEPQRLATYRLRPWGHLQLCVEKCSDQRFERALEIALMVFGVVLQQPPTREAPMSRHFFTYDTKSTSETPLDCLKREWERGFSRYIYVTVNLDDESCKV